MTREQIMQTGGKFFSLTFIKKDGTARKITARIGVKKNIKGVGLSFNPSDHGLIVVYDIHKRAYRMINLNTIVLTNVDLC
jgi:hypothetical protein